MTPFLSPRQPDPGRAFPFLILTASLIVAACSSARVAAIQTPTPTAEPASTATPTPPISTPASETTPTATAAPGETPVSEAKTTTTRSPVSTPTATSPATSSPVSQATPTASPTARPRGQPTLGYYDSLVLLTATPPTPVPTPASRIPLDQDVVNILLLGTDKEQGNSFRTDTMIVLSINKSTGHATLLSIPRDLYVYIPQWKMERINTADNHGRAVEYPGGGPSLLIQTLLYNFGIPIHYYARVNFAGFRQVVDTLGGIDVPVSCQLDDYVLKGSDLDPAVADNWKPYTIPVGIQHMDGKGALLYARLRQSYRAYNKDLPRVGRPVDDFDRSRRQQQVLRAIYHKALSLDIVPRIPALFAEFSEIVETDMNLGDVLQFVPLVTRVDDINIKSRFISQYYTIPWTTPGGDNVRLPDPERLPYLLDEVFSSPSRNQLARASQLIEVVNGTSNPGWEILAVDRLTRAGFNAVAGQSDGARYEKTTLVDYTTSAKGSALDSLMEELDLPASQVISQPDAESVVHFRLYLGDDYDTCGR